MCEGRPALPEAGFVLLRFTFKVANPRRCLGSGVLTTKELVKSSSQASRVPKSPLLKMNLFVRSELERADHPASLHSLVSE